MHRWKVVPAACLAAWTLPWNASAFLARLDRHGEPKPNPHLRTVGHDVSSDVADKLWEGLDLSEEEHAQLDTAMREVHGDWESWAPAADAKPEIQMLGPPDSGTNLLMKTVQLNWPYKVGASRGAFDKFVWKHSISGAKDLCERFLASPISGENFTILVAIRSPISQLTSWHKAAYSLAPCMSRDYSAMGQSCYANTSPDWHDVTPGATIWGHSPRSLEFENSMAVYNRYLRQYKNLLTEPACSKFNVLLVRYEDMVFTPEEVMKELAQKAGWPLPSDFSIMDSAAKSHGGAVGRSRAMQKINSRLYATDLMLTTKAARCGELNAALVEDQFEKSFLEAPISYMKDCRS